MLNSPKAQIIHQAFIKKFGQRIDIDYLNTEEVVDFFLHSSDEYDRQVLQDRLERYRAYDK
jgi:hypothetical protein